MLEVLLQWSACTNVGLHPAVTSAKRRCFNFAPRSAMSSPETSLSQFVPTSKEQESLQQRWKNGDYARFVVQLRGFTEEKREAIREKCAQREANTAVEAAQSLVVQLGTVHFASEMRDQVKAIHDEIWYRGEEGNYDRGGIMEHWTRVHAPAWRRWRTMEYLFVLEQMAEEVTCVVTER